jgi:Tfp pilus assembly protein PilF
VSSHGPGAAPGAGGAGLYEVLGVGPDAPDHAIRSAITEQRRVWRRRTASPEIEVRQEAERRMQQLDEAERTLLDPPRRRAYNAYLAQGAGNPASPTSHIPAPPPGPRPVPRGGENLLVRAAQQLEAGHFEVAAITARRAVEADPESAYAWSVLAEASAGADDAWAAKEAIDRALSLEPENPTLHVTRGWIFTRTGEPARALSAYRAAARLDPRSVQLRLILVRVLLEQGRLDDAITEAEITYQAHPDDGDARTMLARALADRAVAAQHELPNGRLLISTAPQASYVEALSNRGLSVQAPDPAVNEDLTRQRDNARAAKRRRFSPAKLGQNRRYPFGLALIGLGIGCFAPSLVTTSFSPGMVVFTGFVLAVLGFAAGVVLTCFDPQYVRNAAVIEHTVPRRKGRGPGEPEPSR